MPQVILVSVDPERDTVKRMNDYILAFNSHFIGLRSEEIDTEAFEKQLHIASIKMQAEGQDPSQYTVNHSSEILLFNPDAKLQGYLSFPHKAEQLVVDYKLVLSRGVA